MRMKLRRGFSQIAMPMGSLIRATLQAVYQRIATATAFQIHATLLRAKSTRMQMVGQINVSMTMETSIWMERLVEWNSRLS